MFLLLVFTFFSFQNVQAQEDYRVTYLNETIEMPNNIDSFQWNQMPEHSYLQEGYLGWVQFIETPEQAIQDAFKANNLQLLEYVGNRTYLFYFPSNTSVSYLKNNGVKTIIPVQGQFKISEDLKTPPFEAWALEGDKILVTLEYHDMVSAEYVLETLATHQISVKQEYKNSNLVDLAIPNNCLETLSNLPFVKWVELIVAPSIKDDTRGRSLHRANGLDTQVPGGRNYTGAGIGVMVRDDGIVGPHIDFEGRIDNSGASGVGGTHGDGVAGIMAGAGNLDPSMRGMASGSDVYIVNYQANFLDSQTQNLINSGDVQITNSSYSNGCNAGYTTITRTVDQQTLDIPSLLHVFSAGNSNNNNCGYGAGNQWGNITGGHKQGKNVIATANVFFDGSLVNSSSRGPAHDGRIKPDIAANGQNQNSTDENNGYLVFGGTSGAAPGIAGIAAQLYEAYGDANGGALPPSALIKAAMLNTANEAGNIGPDFRFGWGIVNGLRAGMLIEDDRYLSDNISQGATNSHTINVPAGTSQVRFMVYWSDEAASPGASPALVNDLDLLVTDPSNTELEPWVLDHTPNAATLNNPATNGPDHLNNVEQVLINTPAAGDYTIEISGFNVPVGPQEYFVVYEIISEELTLTYPNAGESFVPGETESIHWDAVNTTQDFTLEYSTDNGGSWNAIAVVPGTDTNYGWDVPNEVTGEALVRITSGSFQDQSDEVFSIALQTTNVEVTQVCVDEASFAWDPVADANEYDLYILGAMYMEVVGTTAATSITIPIANPNDDIWFAVVAKNTTENWSSRRTIAEFYGGGLLNCALANDISVEAINNTAADFNTVCNSDPIIISTTLRNVGFDPQSNFTVSYQIDGEPVVEETFTGTINSGQQEIFEFAQPATIPNPGEITLVIAIDHPADQNPTNDTLDEVFYAVTTATPVPYAEDFETNGFPPASWLILNPDEDTTWVEDNVTGSDGASSTVSFMDNYTYNEPNELDTFQTEMFDLTNVTDSYLYFDLAKAQYSSTLFDGLRVEISTDCGVTFSTIYEKENLDLSTVPNYVTQNWSPSSASDWRTEEISLLDYLGENVIFRFININGYGNSTYIDNINVDVELGTTDNLLTEVQLYPNPADTSVTIAFPSQNANDAQVTITNSLGQLMDTYSVSAQTTSLNVSNYATGLYFVTITNNGSSTVKKLIIK